MAANLVQALFSAQNKTSDNSLVLSGSKTITVGNDLFVAWAGDTGGSAYGCGDNLGNTYSIIQETLNAGAVRTILFRAPITVGGTLTTVTVSWTTNITAKGATIAEFSGVGQSRTLATGTTGSGTFVAATVGGETLPVGGLAIGALGVEAPNTFTAVSAGTPAVTSVNAGQTNTSGGSTASNIGVGLYYAIGPTTEPSEFFQLAGTSVSANNAGAGGIYYPATSPQVTATDNLPADNAAQGTVAWTNASQAGISNNSYATIVLTAGQTSHTLRSVVMRFNIPTTKFIKGVEVVVECKKALVASQNMSASLVLSSFEAGNTNTAVVSQTESSIVLGSPTDRWGLTLTPTDVNSASFGCDCWLENVLADTYSVDNIYMRVYFGDSSHIPHHPKLTPQFFQSKRKYI